MRRFELQRLVDETGISGIGVVAQGVEFDDGVCVLRWLTVHRSTAVYASLTDVVTIHGHGGLTTVRFVDHEPQAPQHPVPLVEVLRDFDRDGLS